MAEQEPFDPVVQINTQKFTDIERELILEVVARDEHIRIQEKGRIDHLKEDLRNLREKGVPNGQEESYGRVCKRCRAPLGLIFNSGALCQNCDHKVCKTCRVPMHKDEDIQGWFCTFCSKIRDIKAESGAWFYDNKSSPEKKQKAYGSFLLKRLFSTRQKKSDFAIYRDPNWEDIIEETEGDDDVEEQGYVLVTSKPNGEFSVKEGNLSELLSSKAVVGLEDAHILTKHEYELLLKNQEELDELMHHKTTNESNLKKDEEEEDKPKTLAELSKVNSTDTTRDSDKNTQHGNTNMAIPQVTIDHGSTEQLNLKGNSLNYDVTSDEDEMDDSSDSESRNTEDESTAITKTLNYQNGAEEVFEDEEQKEDMIENYPQSNKEPKKEVMEQIEVNEVEEDVSDVTDEDQENNVNRESLASKREDENGYKTDESQSSSDENIDDKLFTFAQSVEPSATINYQELDDETIQDKEYKQKKTVSIESPDNEFDTRFGFSSMEKVGSVKDATNIKHNDLDLKDFQKSFVRKKKKLAVEKFKTIEHDTSSSSDSTSSSSDESCEIKQVVPERRNSSEEDFESFYNEISVKTNAHSDSAFNVENEEILDQANYVKTSVNEDESDKSIDIDFSSMQNIKTTKPLAADENVSDNDDNIRLFASMVKPKKIKFGKLRTEEQSDKEDSSSSSSDDETYIVGAISKQVNGQSHHNEIAVASINAKKEEEDLDSYFNEFKETKQLSGSTESLGSNYSEEGDGHQSFNVAGEIFVAFKYDFSEYKFEVQVHRAKDLQPADPKKNTTDPYVKVYLEPEPPKKGGKRKTKVKKHSLNPEFDEVLEFSYLEYEDIMSRTCLISVWHADFYKNIRLGEVRVNLQEYINSGFSLEDPSPQWYTLSAKVVNREQITFVGNLSFKLLYKAPGTLVAETKKEQSKLPNPTKGELHVQVVSANNLVKEGLVNPFCKITIISKDLISTAKLKTPCVTNSKDPWWDTSFVIPNVAWSQLETTTLQFSLWNYDRGKSHQLIGGIRIGLGTVDTPDHDSFGDEVNTWRSFLDHPNELLEYSLPIRSNLESVKNEAIPPPEAVKIISDEDHYKIKANKKESSSSQGSLAKRFLNADTISLASSGSMLSIYSDAGGERNDIAVTGEMLFSIKHDEDSGILSVTVIKAKGIAPVNTKALTSDPYVKLYLLPDKDKNSKKKTMHRRKTLNPEWNETIKYKINHEELLKRTLQLSIWNHDRFGRNDFLGEVQINMKHFSHSNNLSKAEPVWYTLQEAAPVSIGDSDESKGDLTLCLKFDQDTLTVLMKEANGLTAANPTKLSNPFIKCYLLPDKSRKSKRKTSTQKKTVSPVWNEKFEYHNIPVYDLQARVLEITVWDHDSAGHQFLGGIRCGLSQGDEYWHDCGDKEEAIWEAMISHLGIFSEYTIPLRATMVSRKGQMTQHIPMITQVLEQQERHEREAASTPIDYTQNENQSLPSGTPYIRLGLQFADKPLDEYDMSNKKKKDKNNCQLQVHIKEARNLPSRYDGETPSTYAKFFLYPKKKNKLKTEIYLKSIEPQWDSEYTVATGVTIEELRHKALEVMIYDVDEDDKGKEREIGCVRLGPGTNFEDWDDSTGSEVEIWNSMLTQQNRWATQIIPLRLTEGDSAQNDASKKSKDKKSKKDKSKKNSIYEDEANKEHDYTEESEELNDGSESPRTSALRAMGMHASTVIDIMHSRDQPEPTPSYNNPQAGLTLIEEEDEGSYGSSPPSNIPQIKISPEVKPGDPPFPGAGYDGDSKKQNVKAKDPPAMTFLKRSSSIGSLTSVYSTDSANIYDQVPIRGDIQFGMKYSQKKGIFEVHVFQARDIAAIDSKKGISDPYCKVYLLPDKTKSGKKKTKTRKKTLNPEWEEILEYNISTRDLRTRTLWIAVWHQERLGRNIFLGEVMLNLDNLVDEGTELEQPTPKWYTLCEKGSPPMVDLYKGQLKIALMFEDNDLLGSKKRNTDFEEESSKKKKKKKKKEKQESGGKIHIHLKEASDLPAADKDGLSDPFCKCYLLPMKHAKSKRKTPVIRHTRDPIWDYKTEYTVDYEDLADHGFELSVWDWDRGIKNDFLGCSRLNLGGRSGQWDDAEGVEILAWQHLIDQPNKWKDFVLPLRSKMDFKQQK